MVSYPRPPEPVVPAASSSPLPPSPLVNPYPQDGLSLSEIWAALYQRKFLVGSVSLLVAILSAASTYLVRPVFRAEVLVSPTTEQRNPLGSLPLQFGGLAELAGVNLGAGSGAASAIATLKSRLVTEAFIKDLNLLPILFEDEWDTNTKRWKDPASEKTPSLWDGYQKFDTSVRKIHDDRKNGLVTLAIEWHDPKAAADWANELVRRTNAKLQQDTIAEGQKTIAYLDRQLASARVLEVRQAIYSLIEVETKNIAVAHAREGFAFKVIDPAVEPRRKFKPKRALITAMGFLLGLIGSALFVLLWPKQVR